MKKLLPFAFFLLFSSVPLAGRGQQACPVGYYQASATLCCLNGATYKNGVCTMGRSSGSSRNHGCPRGSHLVSPTQCCPNGAYLTSDGYCYSPGGHGGPSSGESAGSSAPGHSSPGHQPGGLPVLPPHVPCQENLCQCVDGSVITNGSQCN